MSADASGSGSSRPARIVVAMSGGVDSSVAAALLVEQGHEVIGVSMRLWEARAGEAPSGCCSLDDFLDARLVAERLGIPFYVMDFGDEFRRSVIDDFVGEYRRGRTPNPCARCNQFVKFDALWRRALELGADLIATGHYARLRQGPDGAELLCGLDADKDQSYFLFAVDRSVLRRTRFPVGALTKAEVRREAERRGLAVARKAESQEVCFAPPRAYAEFVERHASVVPLRPGEVVDGWGNVLARHAGVHRFTIGQRRGLGIGDGGRPRYVAAIDAGSGRVQVGTADEVASEGLVATGVNWLGPMPAVGARVSVKIRSRFDPVPARVSRVGAGSFAVSAARGLRAVTPGQAAVLYEQDRVLGGGWIEKPLRRPVDTAEGSTGRPGEERTPEAGAPSGRA